MNSNVAVYPGFFDPFTHGHLNIIERASRVFSNVVVAIANDAPKQAIFDANLRLEMVQHSCDHLKNVKVEFFSGLLVAYLKEKESNVLIRGIRSVADYEYECQMAQANRCLDADIETVFLMTEPEYAHLSSTLIKEICRLGGDVSQMVPAYVNKRLKRYFGHEQTC